MEHDCSARCCLQAAKAGYKQLPLVGPLLENFVTMELRKQSAWSRTRPRMFHFRTQTGREVDIVLENAAGRVVGIEVKASATVGAGAFEPWPNRWATASGEV